MAFASILQKNTQEAEQHTDRASVENLNVNLLAQRNLFATKEVSLSTILIHVSKKPHGYIQHPN